MTVLILEDMRHRVDYMRRFFPDVPIAWAPTVSNFRVYLEQFTPSAIILDHDLGGPCKAAGADGLSGYDAAAELSVRCPVLVWSVNPYGGPRMVAALRANGVRAILRPFDFHLATWLVLHPWFAPLLADKRRNGGTT
ncbi:MAG: cyclic-phosphate processing receiver domain-containing protein [Candidatus Deferrimicrobiaceae bacterium]